MSLAKRFLLPSLALLAAVTICPLSARAALPEETKEQTDQRMGWWRDAKFGMFIHWGLYAIPAGEWNGVKVPGLGEWIQSGGKIPEPDYAKLQHQFNPVKYDAKKWVALAKQAGVKYIVITSKHHDGFCLFDSKLTDYDVMGTPYGRDLLKPLADECHRQGIKICFYHSILDWHQPDAKGKDFPKYVEHLRGQLRELLTNYGPIGVLWFDGEWIPEWTEEQGRDLEKYLRSIQPDLIVNNRVGKRKQTPGDFGTPEQEIPATGTPGWDWETCMTMNDTWGFKKDDQNWKSPQDMLRKLVDITSKGGNFLLNVGPTAEGEIPPPSVERLEAMGRWLAANGESIYGTAASPFAKLDWGRCTRKPGTLYLHVFDWPKDGRLVVPGLENKTRNAYLLADKDHKPLVVARAEKDIVISVPPAAPDPIDTVVVLEIEGDPRVSP
jgi:alpha-L-fucosidase